MDKALHAFAEGSFAQGGQFGCFLGFAVGDEEVPEVLVEGDFGEEGGDLWEHGVVCFAEGRGVAEGV